MNQQLIKDFRNGKAAIDYTEVKDIAKLMSIFRETIGSNDSFYFSENDYFYCPKGVKIIWGTNQMPLKQLVTINEF
jgi:hypothetical protein